MNIYVIMKRFEGFGTLYDGNQPRPPQEVLQIVTKYLRSEPQTVVDVGYGTGLSTSLWLNKANCIIGIEPNDDMRKVALCKMASN